MCVLFGCLCLDAADWQAFIMGEDETGRSTVRLCGMQEGRYFCINDLLVQQKYAAAVGSSHPGMSLPDAKMRSSLKFTLTQPF